MYRSLWLQIWAKQAEAVSSERSGGWNKKAPFPLHAPYQPDSMPVLGQNCGQGLSL